MIEVRFHGRGGQGAVTAAELLAAAAFKDGKWPQAFAAFGPERRGAPVMAFTRIDDQQIRKREQVYTPDVVVVLEPSLLTAVDVLVGLKKGGIVLINTDKPVKLRTKARVFTVDATAIAVKHIGKPIVNTAMLGALVKATGAVSMASLSAVVDEKFSKKKAVKPMCSGVEAPCFDEALPKENKNPNLSAMEDAYNACVEAK